LKRDLTIAVIAMLVVGALCFAISQTRPQFQPKHSKPIELPLGAGKAPEDHVVMRVNGTPVTEAEFELAFRALPEEMQRQFSSVPGKQAFAEQYVRMKLLEQEGEKLGVDKDPRIKSQLAAERTNLVGGAAFQKVVKPPTDEAAHRYYAEHKKQFESVELSHIVIAYQGGMLPPKNGGTPPPEQAAAQKALEVSMRARQGADFAALARQFSDDPASADTGGLLGPVSHGMLPRDIEPQVFKLQPGQVSGPIESRYGIHVFKLGARTPTPFEKVRTLVLQQLQQQNAYDRVERLHAAAKIEFDPIYFPEAKTWGKTPGSKNPS
jgi:hypothetical protein